MNIKQFQLLPILALITLLTGCAGGPLFTQRPEVVTTQTITTNSAGEVILSEVLSTNILYTVSTNAIAFVDTVNAVNGAIPSPVQPFVNILGGLGLAVLGAIARQKTKKAKQAVDAISTTKDALASVVKGVEAFARSTSPETAASVKQSIRATSINDGTAPTVSQTVQKITR